MEPTGKLQPANWEITAFSLKCNHIGDKVTLRVTRDWLAACAWYLKYKANVTKRSGKKMEKGIKQSIDKCLGPSCSIIRKYREKLIQEEFGKE